MSIVSGKVGVTGVVAEESGGILMGEVGGGASIGIDRVGCSRFGEAVLNGSVHVDIEMLIWIVTRKGVC